MIFRFFEIFEKSCFCVFLKNVEKLKNMIFCSFSFFDQFHIFWVFEMFWNATCPLRKGQKRVSQKTTWGQRIPKISLRVPFGVFIKVSGEGFWECVGVCKCVCGNISCPVWGVWVLWVCVECVENVFSWVSWVCEFREFREFRVFVSVARFRVPTCVCEFLWELWVCVSFVFLWVLCFCEFCVFRVWQDFVSQLLCLWELCCKKSFCKKFIFEKCFLKFYIFEFLKF